MCNGLVSGRRTVISPFLALARISPETSATCTSPFSCSTITRAVRGTLMLYSSPGPVAGLHGRCLGEIVLMTSSSPWVSVATRALSGFFVVVISTSERSCPSMVSSPIDFLSLSTPLCGKVTCSVLVTGALSAASARPAAPKPIQTHLIRVMLSLLLEARLDLGQHVALARHPDVEGGEQEDTHHQVRDQAAHDHDSEGTLG